MTTEPAPEFSRPVRADQIDRAAETTTIAAKAHERAALAKRFGLISLDRLEADYSLTRQGNALLARGRVRAALAQPCAATEVPVPETIDTDFTLRFVPERDAATEGEEIELDVEDCDIIPYDGLSLDMGEAVAETMALAMAPYPRAPNADAILRAAGVLTEEQASPFAALLALKDKTPPKD